VASTFAKMSDMRGVGVLRPRKAIDDTRSRYAYRCAIRKFSVKLLVVKLRYTRRQCFVGVLNPIPGRVAGFRPERKPGNWKRVELFPIHTVSCEPSIISLLLHFATIQANRTFVSQNEPIRWDSLKEDVL